MLGRDVYSRVDLRRARLADGRPRGRACWRPRIGLAIGLVTGFVRWLDAIVMRVMDGLMSIPGDAAGHRADGADQGEPGERDHRHHGHRGAARGAPGAQPGAHACASSPMSRRRSPPARALPRILCAPHPAQHGGAADRAGAPTSAPRRCSPKRSCRSSAPARRPTSRAGATSWPRAAALFQIASYLILFPGIFLSLTVLAVNLLGDGLRDALDPRLARNM